MKNLKTYIAACAFLPGLIASNTSHAASHGRATSHTRAASPSHAAALYKVVTQETPADGQALKQLTVQCPAKMNALGAGWSVLDPTDAVLDGRVTNFEPSSDGSGWIVNAQNNSIVAPNWKLRVRLICAPI